MKNEISALQSALRVIQSECDQHMGSGAGHSPSCSRCPLSINGSVCGVIGIDANLPGNYKMAPYKWDLVYDVRLIRKKEE